MERWLAAERHWGDTASGRANTGGVKIGRCQDEEDAWRFFRRTCIDMPDARRSVRRAQHKAPGLARQSDVVNVAPAPGQEPSILNARDRLADAKFHGAPLFLDVAIRPRLACLD